MSAQQQSFPFRWILPSAQFLICLVLLWPARVFLLFNVLQSVHSYFGPTPATGITPNSNGSHVIVPPLTPEAERKADAEAEEELKIWDKRKTAPLFLNSPVLLAQLPYVIASPSKSEWIPRGMTRDVWHAISWPFAGVFLWWFVGRSVEALAAARRSILSPRITWGETVIALLLFLIGCGSLIGILTSTQDDRADGPFVAMLAGEVLWGIMSTATVTARFLQWRIAKRNTGLRTV